MKPWKHAKPVVIEKVGWRNIAHKVFIDPEGIKREYTTFGKPDTSNIATIALTPKHTVILARQFRPGQEAILDELPGGGMDEGESYEEAARRELAEEVGYTTDNMRHLGEQVTNAYDNTTRQYFIAYDCVPNERGQQTDDGEYVEPIEVSIKDLFKIAKSGKMTDVGAVFLAYEELKKLERDSQV